MNNEDGLALATVFRQKAVLTCFQVLGGRMGNETGLAMADALKQNAVLIKYIHWQWLTHSSKTMADALKQNNG